MSLRLSGVLTLVLAVSLAVKATALVAIEDAPAVDPDHVLVRALHDAGFVIGKTMEGTDPVVTRTDMGDCRLLYARVAPLGWHRNVFSRFIQSDETLSFLFRDRLWPSQPVWETSLSYFRMRLLRYAGKSAREEPVWALVASAGCDRALSRWAGL